MFYRYGITGLFFITGLFRIASRREKKRFVVFYLNAPVKIYFSTTSVVILIHQIQSCNCELRLN